MSIPAEQQQLIQSYVRGILVALGEDPNRPGLIDTPRRVAEMYSRVLDGNYALFPKMAVFSDMPLDPHVADTTESQSQPMSYTFGEYNNIIIVHHVPFYAFCEHHLALFLGQFAIGYLPSHKVLGLSKLVRLFRHFCKRPTIQERLTVAIVDQLVTIIKPRGAMIYVDAEHTCMTLRGARALGARTTTMAARGIFLEDSELRDQFLKVAKGGD